MLGKVEGVVDIVGVQSGNPEVDLADRSGRRGRLGPDRRQVVAAALSALAGRGGDRLRLLDRTIPVRVRYPDAIRFDPARLGETRRARQRTASWRRSQRSRLSVARRRPDRAHAREPAPDGDGHRRASKDATSERRRRDHSEAARAEAAGRLHLGGRRSVPVAAPGLPRAARWCSASPRRWCSSILVIQFRAFTAALLILAAAPLSLAGALLAARADRHGAERLVGDGA